MIDGILPGAIAGLCGGIGAAIFAVIGHATGYWGVPAGASGELVSTIEFWWSQAGAHILVNMLWGTIFGAIFTKVYYFVPGKGIKKGLCYGLIVYLTTTFLFGTYNVGWAIFHNNWTLAQYLAGACWIIGGANGIIFALAFGLLYRKSSK